MLGTTSLWINTMNRSLTLRPLAHWLASAAAVLALGSALAVATAGLSAAQAQNTTAAVERPFPANAVFGTVVIGESPAATVDGKPVRTAPGLRIFDPENRLVHAHQVQGQKVKVRYVIEPATGFLQTVWILAPHELPKTRWFGLSSS